MENQSNNNRQPLTGQATTTTFRLLCHVMNIGGVIGRGASIVKTLEQQTSAKIRVEESVPDCVERVINISGSSSLQVQFSFADSPHVFVSSAQEGLFRVFDRVLEVEAEKDGLADNGKNSNKNRSNGNDVSCSCRLLASGSQIGVVMGKGGKNVSSIGRESGTSIRILRLEQSPSCAGPHEQLIRITGGASSVKKALYAISACLQEHPPVEKAPLAVLRNFMATPQKDFRDTHMEFFPDLRSSIPPVTGDNNNPSSACHSSSLCTEGKGEQQEVKFRLLCFNSLVGRIIGKGGTLVRTLQNESGACINFEPLKNGCDERIVILSALENPTSSYSPAQNAVVRVFARYVEVGIGNSKGLLPNKSVGEPVTARLLISSEQASCFKGEDSNSLAEIKEVVDAEIELLSGDSLPTCASLDDQVVQITGKYRKVQSAILHVTGRLRDNCFPNTVLSGSAPKSYHSYPIPDINHHSKMGKRDPSMPSHSVGHHSNFNQERIMRGFNYLGISQKSGRPHSTSSQRVNGGSTKGRQYSENNLVEGLPLGSENNSLTTHEEVVVPEGIFDCVCSKDGRNLDLMRQISGAEVEVRDPSPGQSDGAVIIRGTRDQILAARSLLQAFIQAAK